MTETLAPCPLCRQSLKTYAAGGYNEGMYIAVKHPDGDCALSGALFGRLTDEFKARWNRDARRHVSPGALEAARRLAKPNYSGGVQTMWADVEAVARELLRIGGET